MYPERCHHCGRALLSVCHCTPRLDLPHNEETVRQALALFNQRADLRCILTDLEREDRVLRVVDLRGACAQDLNDVFLDACRDSAQDQIDEINRRISALGIDPEE